MLEQIKEANDIKLIDPSEYRELAREIRRFLVRKVSRTGGHLASNLGVVELTMAMHLCCDLPEDKIVWDVGHQCYTHKILTGRQDAFDSLRQYGGMSGFPKRGESECDAMDTGHSSTSISAALGLAKARDLQGRHNKIFAVIGDGALSGGMAYEALNNAARLRSNMIIVLNDNQMSISKNVGGMSNYLGKIRTDTNYTELKQDVENALEKLPHFGNRLTERIRGVKDLIKRIFIPGMLFEDMGITYIGPIDGHDIGQMVTAFNSASKLNAAVIVHVVTQKGKGYPPAQKDPSSFHGVGPFRVSDGTLLHSKKDVPTYTNVFQNVMLETMADREDVVAISAAMPTGTGLAAVAEQYPDRFFDVGIAEEHAVTFAAGLALGGSRPVVALYSTFLQRAYDQILHDVCIGSLPVVFAVDRAGLVGSDGETHQGIFDIAFLSQMPNLTVMAPKNSQELEDMFPENTPKEREYYITKAKGAVCILQIGDVLESGERHDGRAPDYDDWSLNADILVYYPVLDIALELSSMGIRVDKATLLSQLDKAGCPERAKLPFQKAIIDGKLPYTIGGGIGQSRICMFFLRKAHIGEVQSSLWPEDMCKAAADAGIQLL